MRIDTESFAGLCLRWERGVVMKYFDDPVYNSQFLQFIDCFAELIEKYGGNIVFPDEKKTKAELGEVTSADEMQIGSVEKPPNAA